MLDVWSLPSGPAGRPARSGKAAGLFEGSPPGRPRSLAPPASRGTIRFVFMTSLQKKA